MGELTCELVARMRDCDARGHVKRSSILRCMQEMSEDHARELGAARAVLLESGMCYVLHRLALRLDRELVLGECIQVTTWPGPVEGLFFPRYFYFEAQGRCVGEAVSSWVLFDIEKRRVLRPGALPAVLVTDDRKSGMELPGPIAREGLAFVEARRVRYTDLDANGHMNNARYADWVQDMLPERELCALQINFVSEGKLGDEVALHLRVDGDRAAIAGIKPDGRVAFEAAARLRV